MYQESLKCKIFLLLNITILVDENHVVVFYVIYQKINNKIFYYVHGQSNIFSTSITKVLNAERNFQNYINTKIRKKVYRNITYLYKL